MIAEEGIDVEYIKHKDTSRIFVIYKWDTCDRHVGYLQFFHLHPPCSLSLLPPFQGIS